MSSLLAAGDEVPADGRIIEASSLQIDESALTGESVPASKGVEVPDGADLAPGEQTDMAFMHTPVTHGSGVMIVTATGGDTEVGKIAGMLATTAREQTPLTRQLNTLTLWIAGGGRDHDGDHVRARRSARPVGRRVVFTSAVALAIAAIPEAMPTVLQVILSLGAADLARARRGAQGPRVGRDARLDVGDQLGQDRHADDEPDDRGRGASIRPTVTRSPARATSWRARSNMPPAHRTRSRTRSCRTSSPATRSSSTARSSATRPRARCSCWPTRPGSTSRRRASAIPGWRRCRSIPPTS